MRLLRQGVAGLFHVGNSQKAANWRNLRLPQTALGQRAADLFARAAAQPGRCSPRSSRLEPSATTATPNRAATFSTSTNNSVLQ